MIITDSRFQKKKKTRPVFKILLLSSLVVFAVWYLFIRANGPFSLFSGKIADGKEVSEQKSNTVITPPINKLEKGEEDPDATGENIVGTEEQTGPEGAGLEGVGTTDIEKAAEDQIKKQEEENKKIEDEKKRLQEEEQAKEKARLQKIEQEKRRRRAAEEKKKKEEEEKLKAEQEAAEKKAEEERLRKEKEEADRKALELKKKKEEEEKNRIKPGQLISLSEADVKPVAVSTPAPKLTRSQKLRQSVIVMALIDHNGNVEKVRILRKSRSKKIDSVITQTIMGWKYKPAEKDGVKVKVWKTINLQ